MSKQAYDNRVLTEYLLGSLPEAEEERFDELSLTEDEFAAALKAAENDLVDAYAQGELTGAVLERFEAHYLASPSRREKARFAQSFRRFADKVAAAQPAKVIAETRDESATGRTGRGWFSAPGDFVAPRLRWGLVAAALALLIAGSWLLWDNARLRRQVSQTEARRDALREREQELQRQLEQRREAVSKL